MSRVVKGECDQQGNADLCGLDRSGSRAHDDRDTATNLGIESCTVLEEDEFAPTAIGIQAIKEAILGSAPMGQGVLGSDARKCDR